MYSKDKIFAVCDEIVDGSRDIKPYVVICQPRRDIEEVPAQSLDGHSIHIDLCGYSHGFGNIGGEKVDSARNYLIEEAIKSEAKYLFFIGEDTVIPWDGFRQLHETAEKNPDAMVCGVYYIKLSSPMIMIKDGDYVVPANVDPGQVYEAWQTGLDAALIPIKLLKQMKESDPEIPMCCIAVNGQGWTPSDPTLTPQKAPFIGEDNFFVHRWRKMGFRLLVNTDVQCLHMDLASGDYTAHPSIKKTDYMTNIPIRNPLTMENKKFLDERYVRPLGKNGGE